MNWPALPKAQSTEGEIPFRAAALNREPSHRGAAHDLVAIDGARYKESLGN
jgi:hypothetical protein